ncbi:MAG: DUF1186 domain-containing protein [Gammaproteobacteria bacterium]|nr:DUF1186 domain-containing protein [Gammaproteobacteria bacterium]
MDIQTILTRLEATDGEFPREALEAAVAKRGEIISELMKLIQKASANLDYILDEPQYMGHIYAIYLLAQFREKRAFPLLTELYSLHGDKALDATGGLLENLDQVLASLCGGDVTLITALIEEEAMNDSVRAIAEEALLTLVACGELSREQAMAYMQSLFRGKLKAEKRSSAWSALVSCACRLHPEEVYQDIRRAFADELIDPSYISMKEMEEYHAGDKEQLLKLLRDSSSLVTDTVSEMSKWGFFKKPKRKEILSILGKLESNTGEFPRQTLEDVIARRNHFIPDLLEILKRAKAEAEELLKQEGYMAHIYALYLLAQFRETRAYPLIADFFSMPGDISLDLTGDVVTEDLPGILAAVCGGDDSRIKALIENPDANGYVRSAALMALVTLVACGEKTRDEVMRYFQELFRSKLEREYSRAWDGLIICCMDLYPEEVDADVRKAEGDELFDYTEPSYQLEKTYAQGKEKTLERLKRNRAYRLIDSTIAEMESWACFKPKAEPKPKPRQQPRVAEVRTAPKIGRNQPCPCGSGKKYKKCCGR